MTETDRGRILREIAEDAEQTGDDAVSPTARRKKRTSPGPSQVHLAE